MKQRKKRALVPDALQARNAILAVHQKGTERRVLPIFFVSSWFAVVVSLKLS